MLIAVDAMGSDGAPDVEVEGAVAASLDSDIEIALVGDEAVLNEKLAAYPKKGAIRVVHASEAIGMDESPGIAVRKKKDSSMLVAMRLVKREEASAFVSAGNTGALMFGARAIIGPIRGVARSALCQTLPTRQGRVALLDLGATVDCTARHLCEFAEMGIAYSQYTLGVENPRVGLLNIGEEDFKGHNVAKEVHAKLRAAPHVNFIGNVEPKAMYAGQSDVVVCDGFMGNIILKTSESVAGFMAKLVKDKLEQSSMSKLGAVLARRSLLDLKATIDPNEYSGAPLLGVKGIVIKVHGSCTAQGVANGIRGAAVAHQNRLIEHIKENIEELRKVERSMEPTAQAEEAADTAETPS